MTSARGALEATEASSQHAAEVLGELPSLFAWDGQGLAISRFQSLLAAAQAKLERTAHLHAVSRSLFGFLLLSMFSLGAWFAGRIVVDGAGAGAVLTVFLCAVLAGSSTQSIRARVKEFNTGRKAAFAVYSLLEMPSSIPGEDEGGFRPAASLSGGRSVVFRNAEIAPMGNGYGINGLDLVCSAGSSTAVRCTPEEFATLYASLLRLVPSIGIQIDSVRLDEYDAPFLRRGMVGVAGAGVPAFGGTIREVICEGVPRATYDENEVWEALYRVGLADSVRTLPGALDSSVLVLGQGQRERLGIARVLYKKAEIIVLDEPAPTLSEAEERELVAAVCAGWEGRRPTVILRSLRDSVERVCEGGAGFHHGQLVDSGALAELAANPSTMFGKLRAAHHAVSARAESPQLRRMRRIGQTDKTSPASGSDSDSYLDSSNASEIDAREPPVDPLGFRKDGSGDTLVAEHGKGFDDDGEMSVVPVPRFSLGDVVNLSKPETGLLILGTLAAIVRGGVMPLFAVTLAQLLSLYAFGTDISVGAHFWCIVVVTIASLEGLVFYLKVLCFEIAGERLTMRVRKRAFDAVLGHPMDWFMVREHSKAAIMKALATDAPKVRGATTSAWGNLIGWLATVVGGLIWSVFLGWKLAVIAWAPVLASFGVSRLEAWAATRFASQERKGYETANRIAGEALFAWRTVVVNGLEERCANKYAVALEVAADAATRGRVVSSLAFGLSQGLLFLSQALFWWLAASLLRPFDYDLLSILMIWSLASFCGSAAARAGELRRVVKDSKRALMSIAMLMAPSAARENGRYLGDAAPVRGAIEVSQLGYDDPDSGESLLAGFDMVIAPGEHVVIVGCSEEEKDALIGLLTGLLTPQRGRIVVDSMDVREWESTVYRQHVASFWDRNVRVFSGTIADNIALGVVGVQPERIVEIGEAVELQDQVRRLDRGWETVIGAGGVAVDAETADRIGLARVVLRQTPLLIVDDPPRGSGARGLVEMAEYGRTVVRFTDDLPSAIKCRIVVVSGGQVIEAGTHAELLENGGAYYALWNGSAG